MTDSPQEHDRQIERMALLEIIALHPERLTTDELVNRLDGTDRLAIVDALKRSGLARSTGEVIEPTQAAVCAVKVLQP